MPQYFNVKLNQGDDVGGIVEAVGAKVKNFHKGDRVAGFSGVIYNGDIAQGAFQTYTVLNEVGTVKLPANVTFEQGSVLPMGLATAGVGLFLDLDLPRTPSKGAVLVWGAASSVGSSVVQVAHAQGWTVFATASPSHHGWIKKIGADHVFDYKDADVASKIAEAVKAAGVTLTRAYDSISGGSAFDGVTATLKAAGSPSGGKLVIVLQWPEDKPKPEGWEITNTFAARHGKGMDSEEFGRWFFNEWLDQQLQKCTIVPVPEPLIVEGGIEATQKAWDTNKAGVSGKKVVIQVK